MSERKSLTRSEIAKQNAHKKHLNTVKRISDAIEQSKIDPEVKEVILSVREFSEYAGVARTWPYKAKGDTDHAKDYAALVQAFEGRNRDVEYNTQYLRHSKKSKWAAFEGRISKLKAENEELKQQRDDLARQLARDEVQEFYWRDKAEDAVKEIGRLRDLNRELEKQVERNTPLSIVSKDRRS